MSRVPMAAVLLALPLLGGCGDEGGVSRPSPPLPNVAGTYGSFQMWLVQVLRFNDNFTASFTCQGSMTIAQSANGALSGFAVVGEPCPPLSFPLSGNVHTDGSITFNTGGPHPPQGPCPEALAVDYSGLVSGNDFATILSARGTTTVACPQFGNHRFTYILSAYRTSP